MYGRLAWIVLLVNVASVGAMLWQVYVLWQNNQVICHKMAEIGLTCF